VSNREHLRLVTSWLSDLANLTAGTAPLADAKTKVAAIAGMLAEDFPAGAFTRQSLAVVARTCKFFPSYAELCDTLSPWWLQHRPPPRQPLLGTDNDNERQAREEQERSDSWRNITDEAIRAKIRSLHGHPKRQELGHFLAIAVKRNAPAKLGMLPPEWLDAPTEPAKVIELRRPPQAVTDA
jgi:hypothetical protein